MHLKVNAPTENETQEISSHLTDATIPTYPHVLNEEKIKNLLYTAVYEAKHINCAS